MEGRRGLAVAAPSPEGTAVGGRWRAGGGGGYGGVDRLVLAAGRVNRRYHDRGPVKMVGMRRRRVEVEAARRMRVPLRKRWDGHARGEAVLAEAGAASACRRRWGSPQEEW